MTSTGAISFHELERALAETVATQKLGTIVSLRVHLQQSSDDAEVHRSLAALLSMVQPTLDMSAGKLCAQCDETGRQLSVLVENTAGRTLFATICQAGIDRPTINLILVGNHGIARLETSDFRDVATEDHTVANRWKDAVERSLEACRFVEFGDR